MALVNFFHLCLVNNYSNKNCILDFIIDKRDQFCKG